jgi:hypothetical protein
MIIGLQMAVRLSAMHAGRTSPCKILGTLLEADWTKGFLEGLGQLKNCKASSTIETAAFLL